MKHAARTFAGVLRRRARQLITAGLGAALALGSAQAANLDLSFSGGVDPAGGACKLTLNSQCRFSNVVTGLNAGSASLQRDAVVTFSAANNGATLSANFDDDAITYTNAAGTTVAGAHPETFSPTVSQPSVPNQASWVEFTVTFYAPGTTTVSAIPGTFYLTSFDTDGSSTTSTTVLREFIEYNAALLTGRAATTRLVPGTSVNGGTNFVVSNSNMAVGGITNDPQYRGSAQYKNVSSFKFTIGGQQGSSGNGAAAGANNARLSAMSFLIADTVLSTSDVDGYKSVKHTDTNGDGLVSSGDTLTYTVTYVNTGNLAASGVQVSDALPSSVTLAAGGITVTGGTRNAAYNGTSVTDTLAPATTIAAGDRLQITIPVTINAGVTDGTALLNQAVATVGAGSVPTDNVDSTTTFPPSVVASGPGAGVPIVPADSVPQTQLSSVDKTSVVVRRTQAISGVVYEDYNYGGGAGRAYNAGQGMGLRPNVRVELYSASGGNVLATSLTNTSGAYTFPGQPSGTYKVRVVNSFVTSSRGGACAQAVNVSTPPTACIQLPVQTYINGNTAQVGGANPGGTDPALSAGALPAGAQSVANVSVGSSDVSNVDFGFNFDTIVNTNDSGQGSLRQFVTNSNALLGNGSLVQVGQTAGKETSIFMVPTGALTGGVAVINLTSILTVTDGNTSIDATTQTANTTTSTGNTNAGALGTGGFVGIDNLPLGKVDRPEVEITLTSALALQISAANFILRGVALHGGNQLILGTTAIAADSALIEKNVFGTTATAFSLPASLPSAQYGIHIVNGSGTIQNNLIGYSANSGVNYLGGGAGLTIQNNEFQQSGYVSAGGDAITLTGSTTAGFAKPVTIIGNLLATSNSSGIQFEIGSVANNTVTDNTITGNGKGGAANRLEGSGIHYLARNATVNSTNSDTINKNVIYNNLSSGIVINFGQKNVTISQNSFHSNGLTSIDFTASDGHVGGNANYGKGNGVTPNDGATVAREGNTGQDYPVFTGVAISGTTLTVSGHVGNATSTVFDTKSAVIELYKADNDGNQNGEVLLGDGRSVPHGEGKTYLGTLTVTLDTKGAFSGSVTVPDASFTIGDSLTSTVTIANNTSEFSANITPTPIITLLKLGRNSTQNTAFVDQTGTVGAKPGDTVEYCIVYTNTGGAAGNFKLTDNVPAGMNALTDGYAAGKGVRWADGTVIAAGATFAPTGSDLTGIDTDSDKGSLTSAGGLGKGIMTLDLGAAGLAADGKGTVCFRAKVP